MKILIQEKFAELYYDENVPCLVVKWIGFLQLEPVKLFGSKFVKTFADTLQNVNNLRGVVSDVSQSDFLTPDLQEYFNDFLKEFVKLGLSRWALVLPENVFAQFTLDQHLEADGASMLTKQVFDDLEKAKAWLKMA